MFNIKHEKKANITLMTISGLMVALLIFQADLMNLSDIYLPIKLIYCASWGIYTFFLFRMRLV